MKPISSCIPAMSSSSRIDGRVLAAALAGLLLALPPSYSGAAEWTLDTDLSETVRYDSNAYLSSVDERETAISVTSPTLKLTGEGIRSQTAFTAGFDIGRYLSDTGTDYENASASLSHSYRGLRSNAGIGLSADYRTTQETEETDTGLFVVDGYRFGYGVAPWVNYDVTQRGRITLNGSWRKVDYIDAAALEDYRSYGASLGYDYRITQTDRLGFRGSYNRFENDDVSGDESDTVSGHLVWRREASERLSTSLLAGPRFTRQTDVQPGPPVAIKTESWGVDVQFDLDWQASELTDISAAASRTVSGSGRGNTVERDLLELGISYRALETLTLNMQGLYQHDDDTGDQNTVDRDFASVNPSLQWRLARNWNLATGYRYRWEEEGGRDAESNIFYIGLAYNFPTWKVGD